MYEDNTTVADCGFTSNAEDDENPVMATGVEREVPMPEVNYNYVNASVMLTRWNSYAIKKVIGRKRDSDGNAVGRMNDKPILDTHEYRVEFDDGEVSELTSNVIADSIYSACSDSVNEYPMMESILNYLKSDKAISGSNKKVVHRGRRFMW